MTQSQRLDRYAAHAVYSGPIISISDDQFEVLQKAGKRQFDNKQRADMLRLFEVFIAIKDRDVTASTLAEQSSALKEFLRSADALYAVFLQANIRNKSIEGAIRQPGWHAAFRAMHRIEDKLKFPLRYQGSNTDDIWAQRKEFVLDDDRPIDIPALQALLNEHQDTPLVDLHDFGNNLNWLRIAGTKALAALRDEAKTDAGAPETDGALDMLLAYLDDIYGKAEGKTRGKMSFIYEALQLIPERIRPLYSADQLESLRKRTDLAKRRYAAAEKRNPI